MSGPAPTSQSRSAAADVRNPLLKLGSAHAFAALPEEDRRQLRAALDATRRAAKAVADSLWRRGRVRRAAYWRACAVYAGHAARLVHPKPSPAGMRAFPLSVTGPNPILELPAAQMVRNASPAAASALSRLLLELRQDAKRSSVKSWATAKSPMASYWADVATYAGHCARFVRAGQDGSVPPALRSAQTLQRRCLPTPLPALA